MIILTGLLFDNCVVEVVRLALHHSPDILLADKDDENPNTLQRKSFVNATSKACLGRVTWHMFKVSVRTSQRDKRVKLKISKYQVMPMPRKRRR